MWWPELSEMNLTLWVGVSQVLSWPHLCLFEAQGKQSAENRYIRTRTSLDVEAIHWVQISPLSVGKSLCVRTATS